MDTDQKEVREAYERRSQDTSNPSNAKETETSQFQRIINVTTTHVYRTFFPREPEITVMDLGCGQLADLHKLVHLGNVATYIGLDFARPALEKAQDRLHKVYSPATRFELYEHDLTTGLPKEWKSNVADVVLCKNALHYFASSELFCQIGQILRPNGLLILLHVDGDALSKTNPLPDWISFRPLPSVKEVVAAQIPLLDLMGPQLVSSLLGILGLPLEPSYRFSFRGMVTNVVERMLFSADLLAWATAAGLQPIGSSSVWEMYEQLVPLVQTDPSLSFLLGPPIEQVTQEERQVLQLYRFRLFRKRS